MKKIILTLCAFPLLITGAEWHVANSGNDKNAGSAAAPLKTIKAAVAKAAPGDTVKLAPGIFREELYIRKSGTREKPVTLAGTRGAKGEYLSIVEAPGVVLSDWKAAPEIAPGVWKTPLAKRPDLMLMDGKMIAFINKLTMALPRWKTLPPTLKAEMVISHFGPKCKRLSGLDLLALPRDVKTEIPLLRGHKVPLFEVICDVLSGWRDGMLYVRLADGSKPEQHVFTASYGSCFNLQNASFWHFRDLHIRGSRSQFRLQQKGTGNRIENSLLMHGGVRIGIDKGVTDTLIRNNIMTAGFIQSELFKLRSDKDMRGGLLYIVFKYIIGTSSSDDIGIRDYGTNTKMCGNIIVQGLIGIDAYGTNCDFSGNVVREMSSIGICTVEGCVGKFHHNLLMNCGIPLRFHHYRHSRAKREEYHYGNLFYQDPHGGGMTFLHSESQLYGPDKENFEPGTDKYKLNPPNPVDGGKFYIYHNTFWGGEDGYCQFDLKGKAHKFRESLPFYFMNNIVKYTTRPTEKYWPRFTLDYQEGLAGNLFYRCVARPEYVAPEEAGVVRFNRVIEKDLCPKLWNGKSTYGLPDVTLSADSPAVGCGVDLSKPQVINGKKIPALPGVERMKAKPDAGALQLGDSQQKFFEMHRKTEETIQMLRKLR